MTERKVIHHQIMNMSPGFGYDGREVIPATALSYLNTSKERHIPGKQINTLTSRRRPKGRERKILGRGIVARVPREGMMVDKQPMK